MGLDANVRCTCFGEGGLRPGPVPVEDLYIDDEGCLASRTLNRCRCELDVRRFDARYGALAEEFDAWLEQSCEHVQGEQLETHVDGISDCADGPTIETCFLNRQELTALNRQTAYNRAQVERASRCGCFHCGGMFAGMSVLSWLPEPDGPDTALCPYCGADAIVTGSAGARPTTAMLAQLYRRWYGAEFRERLEQANVVPDFAGYEDYLRRGIPFLMRHDDGVETVGEVELFFEGSACAGGVDSWNMPRREVGDARDDVLERGAGGLLRIELEEAGAAASRIALFDRRGRRVPAVPWAGEQEDLVIRLKARYGNRLMGLVKDPDAEMMQLVVAKVVEI